MSMTKEQIALELLRLPSADRADLAARLIESLDPEQDSDVEAAWLAEARRRSDEIESGQVAPISAEEAIREIEAELG